MISVGYAGCEAFDIILYIGRTLTKLNYRVLIVDLSGSGAYQKAVQHGMGLDSSQDIVNYRDINYTRKILSSEELKAFHDGVVFVVYGMNYFNDLPFECKQLNVVVNTFPHMLDDVSGIMKEALYHKDKYNLLIRDIVTIDDVDIVEKTFAISSKLNRVNYLYLDISDYESAVECQLSQIVKFTKISIRMKKYIIEQIHELLPQLKTAKISNAMNAAKRGV